MTNSKVKHPDWGKNLTIYEVNLRQYTKSGTIKEFENHLPRLKELGIGILWFMPVQPIGEKNRKGTRGSYYSISDYAAINPEFGTFDDFKSLVVKIHKQGMYVIIDWVANHTAWDHRWTKVHPDFYTKNENGNFKPPFPEWEDVIDLNYNNPELWDKMIGQMEFWIRETNIDGFRCDMAHLVPTLFWNKARLKLEKVKPIFMLAESENHDLLEYAFDSIYNWKLLHAMNNVVAGKINASDLIQIAKNEFDSLPVNSSYLNFTSNHDENSWQGSAIERLHYFLEPLTVLTFTLPGSPLIYNGQEAGNYRRLKFFDKDEIQWQEDKISRLYQKLTHLKKRNPALWNVDFNIIETNASENILAFSRSDEENRILVVMNLSDIKQEFYIKCGKSNGSYFDVFKNNTFEFSCHEPMKISAFGYRVLEKKNNIH